MNVWITGCAGFVGKGLARVLSTSGYNVIGLSRRRCEFLRCADSVDLASDDAPVRVRRVIDSFGEPDAVVHLAAKKPGCFRRSDYVRSNVLATAKLLDALQDSPPQIFAFASTLSVYGRPDRLPVEEGHPTRPMTTYAATKLCAEHLVRGFQDRSRIVILRLPSLYGVGQPDSFIDGLARQALQGDSIELFSRGEVIRDTLHLHDVVGALIACLERPPAERFCCLNLGCGRAITVGEYAEILVKLLASRSAIIPSDRPSPQGYDLYASIEQARRLISFAPTALCDSLEMYANELRAQS